jgi:hypothetical protein
MVTLSKAILIQIGDTLLFLDGQVTILTKEAHKAGTLYSNRRGWESRWQVQHSDHTMSSFCEGKYIYAIHSNLRMDRIIL